MKCFSLICLLVGFSCRILFAAEMVFIPGGTFPLGDSSGAGEADERPVHTVTLADFYLAKFEVTQKEWQAVTGNNPSVFHGKNLPVENVSWYDAVNFCNQLSQKESLTPCYQIEGLQVTCDFSANGYRLPTEAEWEFAARGGQSGKNTLFSGAKSPDKVAWFAENAGGTTHPVGKKSPNELGIFDLSGNVYEWTWNRFARYTPEPAINPVGPEKGGHAIFRGGSWFSRAENLRVSFRNRDELNFKSDYLGLRLCRTKK